MSDAALDMMFGLVLESGARWGEVAAEFQVADATAIFSAGRPHRHFITRPRGGSKTTDLGGVALSWLAVEAPERARGYVVASNAEQAAILIDAAAGLVTRTPELGGLLGVENERLVGANGAWIRVLSLSDSGAWGLRDAHLLICDEFAQWPETRAARRVWTAIRSTVQKVDGCRLVLLSSAGEPSHWSFEDVMVKAKADPTWRVSEAPGPVPWQDPIELESLRRELRPSEYERLILNHWAEDEDRAVSPENYDWACQLLSAPVPLPGVAYIICVDVGITRDATVMVVAHKEPVDSTDRFGPHRVVVDHVERWLGSKRRPVRLASVEDWLVRESRRWNRAKVYADPTQFRGSVQALNRRGVRASEWQFTASSVGEVATALVQTFRNQQIWLRDTPELKEELLRVRLRESSPGVVRLDHDKAAHDDQAVTIGMACHILLGQAGWGVGPAYLEFMRSQIAARGTDPDPAVRAVRRHHRSVAARRSPPARVARCEHRWRTTGTCVFCAATRQAAH